MTSVEIIAAFSAGPCPVLFAVANGDGARLKLIGTKEEAAVWTGWTTFSSRAFQNLPGASLKQKEEEEVGFPVGTLQTTRDPKGTATLNIARGCRVKMSKHHGDSYILQKFPIMH